MPMTIHEITKASSNGSVLTSKEDINALLEKGLTAVENIMYEAVNSDVTVLRDASHHILEAGGKRVRPRLVLLSFFASGGRKLDDIARIAAAVELVHTASVVHDDINDHGVMRRGRPSVNSIWGRTFALLTGDFLFTKVYELMAPYKDLNVTLAEATVALVEGETLQASAVKENNLTREVYTRIIGLKTAALFKSGAKLGAALAGASENQIEALGNFGFNIGLSFQIIDDILDLTASSDQLGKTAGIDLEQGRGFGAAYASDSSQMQESDPMDTIKRKLLDGGAIEKGYTQAQMLINMAINELEILPQSNERLALVELAHLMIDRDK